MEHNGSGADWLPTHLVMIMVMAYTPRYGNRRNWGSSSRPKWAAMGGSTIEGGHHRYVQLPT